MFSVWGGDHQWFNMLRFFESKNETLYYHQEDDMILDRCTTNLETQKEVNK